MRDWACIWVLRRTCCWEHKNTPEIATFEKKEGGQICRSATPRVYSLALFSCEKPFVEFSRTGFRNKRTHEVWHQALLHACICSIVSFFGPQRTHSIHWRHISIRNFTNIPKTCGDCVLSPRGDDRKESCRRRHTWWFSCLVSSPFCSTVPTVTPIELDTPSLTELRERERERALFLRQETNHPRRLSSRRRVWHQTRKSGWKDHGTGIQTKP